MEISLDRYILQRNIHCFGKPAVITNAMEELAELITAVCKMDRDTISYEKRKNDLLGEVGDAFIVLENLRIILNMENSSTTVGENEKYQFRTTIGACTSIIGLIADIVSIDEDEKFTMTETLVDILTSQLFLMMKFYDISEAQVQSMVDFKQGRQLTRIEKEVKRREEDDKWNK